MKLRELIPLGLMSKPTDIMPIRYNLGMKFEVVNNNNQTCITNLQQVGRYAILWFIDESNTGSGVRAGVTGSN